jgi:hypothetical protein
MSGLILDIFMLSVPNYKKYKRKFMKVTMREKLDTNEFRGVNELSLSE